MLTPAPPAVVGLDWRAIGRDDLGAVGEVAAACQAADGGLGFLNESFLIERYFPEAPGAGIGAFDAAGRMAAWATVHVARKGETERAAITGQVRPEWRGRGLGDYLMRWGEAQGRALFAAAPDQRVLQVATESFSEPARRLYQAHGFAPMMEELVMRRDLRQPLPDCAPPPGVTLTTWQRELAGQFFQAYENAFRERPGFPGYSASEWIGDWLENENAVHEWSLLARAGDEPAGFVLASREYPGPYVVQVGVVPRHRRRGVGSALLVETMRRMQTAGEATAQLGVHINNPGAIEAYERLGFVTTGRRARFERMAEAEGA